MLTFIAIILEHEINNKRRRGFDDELEGENEDGDPPGRDFVVADQLVLDKERRRKQRHHRFTQS